MSLSHYFLTTFLLLSYIGKRYFFLTIVDYFGKNDKDDDEVIKCQCDCGKCFLSNLKYIQSGKRKSCGCTKGKPKGYSPEQEGQVVKGVRKISNQSNMYHPQLNLNTREQNSIYLVIMFLHNIKAAYGLLSSSPFQSSSQSASNPLI